MSEPGEYRRLPEEVREHALHIFWTAGQLPEQQQALRDAAKASLDKPDTTGELDILRAQGANPQEVRETAREAIKLNQLCLAGAYEHLADAYQTQSELAREGTLYNGLLQESEENARAFRELARKERVTPGTTIPRR